MSLIRMTAFDEFLMVPRALSRERMDQLRSLVGGPYHKIYHHSDRPAFVAYCNGQPDKQQHLPNSLAFEVLAKLNFVGSLLTPGTFLGDIVLAGENGIGLTPRMVDFVRDIYDKAVERRKQARPPPAFWTRPTAYVWRASILLDKEKEKETNSDFLDY